MKCPVCKSHWKIRSGPYGNFYYCPNGNHGTISVAKYNYIKTQLEYNTKLVSIPATDLLREVEHRCMSLGGVITETEKFFIDNETFYDNPEDFWKNCRPY